MKYHRENREKVIQDSCKEGPYSSHRGLCENNKKRVLVHFENLPLQHSWLVSTQFITKFLWKGHSVLLKWKALPSSKKSQLWKNNVTNYIDKMSSPDALDPF